jgi:hypothetical protein
MMKRLLGLILIGAGLIQGLPGPAWAGEAAPVAVARFLASKESAADQESAESQGSAEADLDGDGVPEVVLVWTTLGPTYWRNTLSILKPAGGRYREAASLGLQGEAKLAGVADGRITVAQKVAGPNDPLCCPSLPRRSEYRFTDGRLVPVN